MKKFAGLLLVLLFPVLALCQITGNEAIKGLVEQYKKDARGPYKDIRWFCKDGTTRPPQERCPEPGLQRARYKDEVLALGRTNQVYLGQILATTDFSEFWDAGHYNTRLKQYQLGKYLYRSDNGWILRKAQYYRGAFQAEDEENWGVAFFEWLLKDEKLVQKQYYLIREAARDIPHQGDDSKTQLIRSLSKEISDSIPSFLSIRIKIHGQPDETDIATVKKFRDDTRGKISAQQKNKLDELIKNMEIVYRPADLSSLDKHLQHLDKQSTIGMAMLDLRANYTNLDIPDRIKKLSTSLLAIREAVDGKASVRSRLALIDISLKLEDILFRELEGWPDKTVNDLVLKTYYLGIAAAGCGYIERWEWEEIKPSLEPPAGKTLSLGTLTERMHQARRLVEWSTGMSRATYKDVVDLYSSFEPMARGFEDDRIRSGALLYLGQCVSALSDLIARESGLSNHVMSIQGQGHIRGINPGYALGELVVVKEITDLNEIAPDKIYVFNHPPADLKPVAGIATVTEGNLVSHVQLLARNLGIPNAVVAADNLDQLLKHKGEIVFYAVSNKGTVIMKPAEQMTTEEKALFTRKSRKEEKVKIPVDKILLNQTTILDLREVNATHSGLLCGPKAANLGELKRLFPEHVVEGLVIPFGIFRQHMDQAMPGGAKTYWGFLTGVFEEAERRQQMGMQAAAIDAYVLSELQTLRQAIQSMPLLPEFVADLENTFAAILGKPLGKVPVFLRSDTNMEDLKDFTGAGLNLTLFNVVEREKILQGIKDVWASPYSERSYKWRQRFLLNPENVYPSILVIPSVDVDYSGVLITRGLVNLSDDDLTIAFSRGAGGAVEGQAAESYLLTASGENILSSPAREPVYNRLPESGGTKKMTASFENPILKEKNLAEIRRFASLIKNNMTEKATQKSDGPYDVELGFKDNALWLFQIRPFVENKNALKTGYLNSITPAVPVDKNINLNTPL